MGLLGIFCGVFNLRRGSWGTPLQHHPLRNIAVYAADAAASAARLVAAGRVARGRALAPRRLPRAGKAKHNGETGVASAADSGRV